MSEPSRRSVLGGTLLAVAAVGGAGLGFTRKVHHQVAVPPPAPPAALTQAVSAAAQLLAGYDACLSADAGSAALLTALRSDIVQHQAAVTAVLENYPGWRLQQAPAVPTASPGKSAGQPTAGGQSGTADQPPAGGQSVTAVPPASTVAALRTELTAQQDVLSQACYSWPDGEPQSQTVVPLFGSMSACLGVHAALLA